MLAEAAITAGAGRGRVAGPALARGPRPPSPEARRAAGGHLLPAGVAGPPGGGTVPLPAPSWQAQLAWLTRRDRLDAGAGGVVRAAGAETRPRPQVRLGRRPRRWPRAPWSRRRPTLVAVVGVLLVALGIGAVDLRRHVEPEVQAPGLRAAAARRITRAPWRWAICAVVPWCSTSGPAGAAPAGRCSRASSKRRSAGGIEGWPSWVSPATTRTPRRASWPASSAQMGITYPTVRGTRRVQRDYRVEAFPTLFVIRPNGVLEPGHERGDRQAAGRRHRGCGRTSTGPSKPRPLNSPLRTQLDVHPDDAAIWGAVKS